MHYSAQGLCGELTGVPWDVPSGFFFLAFPGATILDLAKSHMIVTRSHMIQDGGALESRQEEALRKKGDMTAIRLGTAGLGYQLD